MATVPLVAAGIASPSPLAGGVDDDPDENREVGLAISTTPNNEIMAAICSILVKGSWMRYEQAQHAILGAKKVITVASARGRYMSESMRCNVSPNNFVIVAQLSNTYSTSQTRQR